MNVPRRMIVHACLFVTLSCAVMASISAGSASLARQIAPQGKDWKLVRSVSNPYGGTHDFVLIPDRRKRDEAYYLDVANTVCRNKRQCVVNFWTYPAHIPESADMRVADLAVMTAEYERHPSYQRPVLQLACWLYPNKEVAERAKCMYMPGADIPWKK